MKSNRKPIAVPSPSPVSLPDLEHMQVPIGQVAHLSRLGNGLSCFDGMGLQSGQIRMSSFNGICMDMRVYVYIYIYII